MEYDYEKMEKSSGLYACRKPCIISGGMREKSILKS